MPTEIPAAGVNTWSSPLPGILDTPSLNMLAGASGIGKTALISSIARVFRDGGTLFGHPVTVPPAIGYVGADRGGASAKLWFEAAGYPEIPQYSLVDDHQFDITQLRGKFGGAALLSNCIDKLRMPHGSLIFVDPIALFVGSNLLDYRAVAIACIEIQRWLTLHPYILIGVCHTSKQKADAKDRYMRPQDRILGTGALLGYSSTQMYLMGPEEAGRDDGQHTFVWNPHHRPEETFTLRRTNTGLFDLRTPLGPLSAVRDPLAPELVALLALFPTAEYWLSTAALLEQSQLPPRTLNRYLRELEDRKLIWQPAKGRWSRVYQAVDDQPQPTPDAPQVH